MSSNSEEMNSDEELELTERVQNSPERGPLSVAKVLASRIRGEDDDSDNLDDSE